MTEAQIARARYIEVQCSSPLALCAGLGTLTGEWSTSMSSSLGTPFQQHVECGRFFRSMHRIALGQQHDPCTEANVLGP